MADPPRPDPELGVFETLLVLDGHPVELEAHLERLAASLEELFPHQTAPDLDAIDVPVERGPYGPLSTGTSSGNGAWALRIAIAPGADGELETRIERRHASPGDEISLRSLSIPGGLGAHKWADRSLLDAAQARLPADSLSLIADADGAVLEASRANVFAVRDGALSTPPLDGRILPGVTRMRVLELAGEIGVDIHEAELSRHDLLSADEVFLTGSVRGIERAGSIDGAPLRGIGEIADRLAAELWRSWTGAQAAPLR